MRKTIIGAALSAALSASAAAGQGAPDPLPPEDFEGAEYIDGAGCAFVRFTLDGEIRWAPRLTENGNPVCGLTESEAAMLSASVSGTPRNPVFSVPGIYLQVGAFGSDARADWTVEQLGQSGYGALRLDMDWSMPISIVYAGPFPSREDAEAARQSVRALGFADAFLRIQD